MSQMPPSQPPPGPPGPPGGWEPPPGPPPGPPGPPGAYDPGWGQQQPPSGGGSNSALFIAIALVVIAAVGVGAFFLLQGDDDGGGDGGEDGGGEDVAAAERDDPQFEPYVEAISSTMTADEEFPGSEEEARCMAEAFVGVVGIERMAAEVTPEEISANPDWELEDDPTPEEAEAMYDGMNACMDVRALLQEEWAADPEVAPAAACMSESMSDEVLRELMVTGMLGEEDEEFEIEDPELREQMATDLAPCATDMMRESMAADAGEAFADCAVDAMGEELMADLIVAGMMEEEDPALQSEVEAAIAPCESLAE